jgi:hypothetical protein
MDQTTIQNAINQLKSLSNATDLESVVVAYDQDSDTIHVHLLGRSIPAVSLVVGDDMLVRWDRTAQRVVGVQIERFLSHVAPQHPELLDLLDIAELNGISTTDIGGIRRDVARHRRTLVLNRLVKDLNTVTTAAD